VINLAPNFYMDAAIEAAAVGKMIGGKGTVLGIHAIPSLTLDKEMFKGYADAFKHCPGISFQTSLVGQFSPSVAQTQVQRYLASHPQTVAATVQVGGMATGIIGAFQQAGRPVPAMANYAPSAGSLSWWLAHKASTKEIDGAYPPVLMASASVSTVKQMLAGHNPSINVFTRPSFHITAANLSQYAKPGRPLGDPSFVQGPASTGLTTAYLEPLFN
jgi:ABC-type sugar transport system substrate-binding protein